MLLLVAGAPGLCLAFPYSVPLDGVETEEDAYELYYEGNLDEEELERLVAMLQDPVDLNSAEREELYDLPGLTWPMVDAILAYRDREGRFRSLDDLALLPEVPRDVLNELRSFAEVRKPLSPRDYLRSSWQFKAAYNPEQSSSEGASSDEAATETEAPPTLYIKSHNEIMRWLNFGFALTEAQELAPLDHGLHVPVFDSDGDPDGTAEGYLTDGLRTRWELSKIYLHTPRDRYSRWSAIAGSYRIGFGMGTVFDNTSREFPKGWRADVDISRSEDLTRASPVRYRDDPGLFGAAASLHRLDLGSVFLSAHAFASRIGRNSYQELMTDPEEGEGQSIYICERARDSGDCEFRTDPADGKKIYKLYQVTVLDALQETTCGANVNVHLDPRTQVGVTAYRGSLDIDLPHEQRLKVSRGSKYPDDDDEFGAVGGHLFWGLGPFTLRAEGAQAKSGGRALWLRTFFDQGPLEAELGLRRYDDDYENPWGSPYAQADEYNGNRARDEQGINYVLGYRPFAGLSLKLRGDFWQTQHAQCWIDGDGEEGEKDSTVSFDTARCLAKAKEAGKDVAFQATDNTSQELSASWRPTSELAVTLRGTYVDHDLSVGGRDQTFQDGAGSKLSLFGKVAVSPVGWLQLNAGYRFAWVDDNGPYKLFDPVLYETYKDVDRNGSDESTHPAVPDDPDCFVDGDIHGEPLGRPPKQCSLFHDKYRLDYYFFYELIGKYQKTTASLKLKYYDEAVGYPSVVGDQGKYWVFTAKIRQSKTLDLFSAALRYDLLKFVDDRVKWYKEDLRASQHGRLLMDRYNHQLTLSAELTF